MVLILKYIKVGKNGILRGFVSSAVTVQYKSIMYKGMTGCSRGIWEGH